MKRILFVDSNVSGHHIPYINALVNNSDIEAIVAIPKDTFEIDCKKIIYNNWENGKRSIFVYYKWIKEILKIANDNNVDIVHFLYGDLFYRFFGLGLRKFNNYRTIITMHSIRSSVLNRISLCRVAKSANALVVHSEHLLNTVRNYGINNSIHIEYPCFNTLEVPVDEARDYFGLSNHNKVLGCIGGTRYNKGLDILINALNGVDTPCTLFVAGRAQDFDEGYICKHLANHHQKKLFLRVLSEWEFAAAISASDFIVLPYRESFNGASGPLGEGVFRGKTIIGPDHGNLGYTISKHHLGYTFKVENMDSLAETISRAVNQVYEVDNDYSSYRNMLLVDSFKEKYNEIYR